MEAICKTCHKLRQLRGHSCNACCVSQYRRNLKRAALTLAGGQCVRCGYDKCARALSFHHRIASEKSFNLSRYKNLDRAVFLAEARKCDLLCANCHAEEHCGCNRTKACLQVITPETQRRVPVLYACPICSKRISSDLKYCSIRCAARGRRKVKRPAPSQLRRLIERNSISVIADRYGVSASAVRKWLRSAELLG